MVEGGNAAKVAGAYSQLHQVWPRDQVRSKGTSEGEGAQRSDRFGATTVGAADAGWCVLGSKGCLLEAIDEG